MAVKKKKNAPLQPIKMDPAVQAFMSQGAQAEVNTQREKELKVTEYQRRKREFDKSRIKATYDLPKQLKKQLTMIAKNEEVPASHLAALFLNNAVQQYLAGQYDLKPYKIQSRHPAFRFFLSLIPQTGWGDDLKEDGWKVVKSPSGDTEK